MTGIGFEIRVRGWVEPDSIDDLGADEIISASADTLLIGRTIDQSALFGLLSRLRAQGLTILEVRRQPGPEERFEQTSEE